MYKWVTGKEARLELYGSSQFRRWSELEKLTTSKPQRALNALKGMRETYLSAIIF